MTRQPLKWLGTLALALFMVSLIRASGDTMGPPPRFGAGVMIGASTSPYEGDGSDLKLFPSVSYTGERFFIRGPFAGLHVHRTPSWALNLTADYAFEEDAFEDSPALRGMDERGDTMLLGVDANLRFFENWRLDLLVKTDVLGRHDGQKATLVLSQKRRFNKTTFAPGVGVTWQSPNFNDFYYGVDEREIRTGRPAYRPGDSLEWFLSLTALHRTSPNVTVAFVGKLHYLSSELQDSPIVDDDAAFTALINTTYSF